MKFPKQKSTKSQLTVTVAPATSTSKTSNSTALKELQDKCYAALMTDVKGIAGALDVSVSTIINMIAIRAMSQQMPTTVADMMKIPHVTKANFEKYGKALLQITQRFAAEKLVLMNELAEAEKQMEQQDDEDFDGDWTDNTPSSSKTKSGGRGKKRYNKATKKSYGSNKRFKSSNNNSSNQGKSSVKKNSRKPQGGNSIGLVDFTQNKQFLRDPLRFASL